jgi:Kef-type K+ transport system membrane component KefB
VAWVTLLDIVTVLAVPLVLAGAGPGRAVAGAALVVAAAAGAYAVFRLVRGTAFLIRLRSRSREEGWALDLRAGLALLFGLAALAAVFGTSVLVAGFAAGSLLALAGEPRRLAQQLLGVAEGFLVPFFFVVLGARLEFSALADSGRAIALCAGLLVASTVLHVLVVVLVRRPVAVGLVASAALGVPAAVVSIGLTQGVLDAAQAAAVVVAALGSVAISGVGGMLLRREAGAAPVG